MIKHLAIQNYESHADTEVEFNPGVNVIVGLSDAGKSALFRSMCWAMFNRPSGDVFMRRGTKETHVVLTLHDGAVVTRGRTKSTNTYRLDDEVFTAFGSDVPDDIAAALNMDRGLNVAGQIDPIFLLQESPGEVARHFNDTAGLSDIDFSLSYLQGKERNVKREVAAFQERERELGDRLQQYEGLHDVQTELEAAERLSADIAQHRGRRGALAKAISTIRGSELKVEGLKVVAAYDTHVAQAIELQRKIQDKREEVKRWRYAIRAYKAAAQQIQVLEPAAALVPQIEDAEHVCTQLKELRRSADAWEDKIAAFKRAESKVISARRDLEDLEEQWHETAPDVCPLCDGAGRLDGQGTAPSPEVDGQRRTARGGKVKRSSVNYR